MFKWWKTGRNAREIILREAMLHDIIKLPSEASVDQDHELQVHDIIRLPHEVRVDQDHEAMLHDIIKRRAGVIQISGVPALFIFYSSNTSRSFGTKRFPL